MPCSGRERTVEPSLLPVTDKNSDDPMTLCFGNGHQLGTSLAADNFLTSVQHHPIATLCASYCSEVSKYLAVTRPGTFPDVRELNCFSLDAARAQSQPR